MVLAEVPRRCACGRRIVLKVLGHAFQSVEAFLHVVREGRPDRCWLKTKRFVVTRGEICIDALLKLRQIWLRCKARGDIAGTYCVTAAGRVQCRDFS